ncbi:calcium-translocating P-type ATPase, PMCA-type [Purpureocillium lavendulum]|uniref:Calcium-translocating P-type ATPase, PMCA-type n=1 Tax=Purpureocillium lavendulum TaxID=1247861 RepID=A0AB34FGX6_9HYPO|nr:calcium-translocating P-type ATPase, PMCA-type [Purpureocillium lavendulum]
MATVSTASPTTIARTYNAAVYRGGRVPWIDVETEASVGSLRNIATCCGHFGTTLETLKRWQAFRKWQIDNRGLVDDDGGFPAFVETMKRLYAKDESTAALAQLEAGPSWLKSAWLEERRARRWQRPWQRERGCNGFSDYVDAVMHRLGRQGFTRPFQLQEDPNQANPK